MPEYLAPGVYIEEIAGPRAIEGVSTSTTGMVGQTERGPTRPRLVTSWLEYQRWYGGYIDVAQSYLPYAVKGFFDNSGQRLFVARVHGPEAVAASAEVDTLFVEATGAGGWGNNVFVRVSRPGAPDSERFSMTILYYSEEPPTPLVDPLDPQNVRDENVREPDATEIYTDLGHRPDGSNYVLNALRNSKLVEASWLDSENMAAPANTGGYVRLEGGDDGGTEAGASEYAGDPDADPDEQTGLLGLQAIDEIAILYVPDHTSVGTDAEQSEILNNVVNQCEQLKDRFAILHIGQAEGDVQAVNPPLDSKYAAVYYPWIRVFNPITREPVLVPPGGHVAGIYARTDVERGVHKAPANEVVRGILTTDLNGNIGPLEFRINKGQHDILNPKGVNVIRDFRPDGRGVRVWGARTISSDPEWKYVNVRRLFIFIEESIDEGTQWVVFEPNHEPTWAAVRRTVSGFLTSVWRSGALMGATAEEAFFVKCDRSTMTQDDIDNGRLICYVGVAPVKPAEFVIFRISQKTVESEA